MTIYEFTDLISDRYILSKDDDGKTASLYQKDFGFYSPSKLEKVWKAVKRYHKSNFAPNYSAIADCMEKAGIAESTEQNQLWYQKCNKCGTKYVMGVVMCPKCNKHLELGNNYKNDVTVIKCQSLPDDLIFTRQACPICPVYRQSRVYPKGIKCDSYQGEMRGNLPECDNCRCKECCIDLGSRNENMPSGTLMSVVSDLVDRRRS